MVHVSDARFGVQIWPGDSSPPSHWGLSMRLNDGDKKFGLTTPAAVFGHHGGAGAMVRCVSTFSCSMAIEARSARAIRNSSIAYRGGRSWCMYAIHSGLGGSRVWDIIRLPHDGADDVLFP